MQNIIFIKRVKDKNQFIRSKDVIACVLSLQFIQLLQYQLSDDSETIKITDLFPSQIFYKLWYYRIEAKFYLPVLFLHRLYNLAVSVVLISRSLLR